MVAASSRFLSVEISFDFLAGSKWATLFPNGGPFRAPHRCTVFKDFTGTKHPGQSILLSISGYFLALDAKSKIL